MMQPLATKQASHPQCPCFTAISERNGEAAPRSNAKIGPNVAIWRLVDFKLGQNVVHLNWDIESSLCELLRACPEGVEVLCIPVCVWPFLCAFGNHANWEQCRVYGILQGLMKSVLFFSKYNSLFSQNLFFPFQFIGILFLFFCLLALTFTSDGWVVSCISDPLGMISPNQNVLLSPKKKNLLF